MGRSLPLLAVISVAAVAGSAALARSDRALFQPYFGRVHPVIAVATVSAVGVVLLEVLHRRVGLAVLRVGTGREALAIAAGLATVFAVVAIIIDVVVRLPADLNVRLPQAVAFYPLMGYVAEIAFHVAPLTLLVLLWGMSADELAAGRVAWLVLAIVAMIEPTFQTTSMDRPLSRAGILVWLNLFALNLVQLQLFRRHDFVTMYVFRLVYYLHWHLIWGFLRLRMLY